MNVANNAGKSEEYNHRFFHRVRDMVSAGDEKAIFDEKIVLKLLRLSAET